MFLYYRVFLHITLCAEFLTVFSRKNGGNMSNVYFLAWIRNNLDLIFPRVNPCDWYLLSFLHLWIQIFIQSEKLSDGVSIFFSFPCFGHLLGLEIHVLDYLVLSHRSRGTIFFCSYHLFIEQLVYLSVLYIFVFFLCFTWNLYIENALHWNEHVLYKNWG